MLNICLLLKKIRVKYLDYSQMISPEPVDLYLSCNAFQIVKPFSFSFRYIANNITNII